MALSVSDDPQSYAVLYIWREKRKDAPIHEITASVSIDNSEEVSKLLEVAPIYCAGYCRRQIEKYVQKDVMSYLNARFGIAFFSDEIRLEPIECPIEGCPYAERFAASQKQLVSAQPKDD